MIETKESWNFGAVLKFGVYSVLQYKSYRSVFNILHSPSPLPLTYLTLFGLFITFSPIFQW